MHQQSSEAISTTLNALVSQISLNSHKQRALVKSHIIDSHLLNLVEESRTSPREWSRQITRELNNLEAAMYFESSHASNSNEKLLEFMYLNYSFVHRQLAAIFSAIEGVVCSSDKASAICQALTQSWKAQQPSLFNTTLQQYPIYAHPQRILTTYESALTYFNAISALYFGRNQSYLQCVLGFLSMKSTHCD